MNGESTNVVLDSALLLERYALETTLERIPELGGEAGLDFFVTASVRAANLDPESDDALRSFFEIDDLVDPQEAVARLGNAGVSVWEPPDWAREEFAPFYDALGEAAGSPIVQDILFEEWFFLTHESWLVSRIRKPFDAMVDAGELGVEVLNKLVRKTLKKDPSHVVRITDRLRALGKWIAVGGAPAVGLINPIAGVAVQGVAGGFLLLDPPPPGSENT